MLIHETRATRCSLLSDEEVSPASVRRSSCVPPEGGTTNTCGQALQAYSSNGKPQAPAPFLKHQNLPAQKDNHERDENHERPTREVPATLFVPFVIFVVDHFAATDEH